MEKMGYIYAVARMALEGRITEDEAESMIRKELETENATRKPDSPATR